jgi:formate dehydrogenase subunit gamma
MSALTDVEQVAPAATWVLRFTRTERVAHWVQATSFLALLCTGMVLGLSALEGLIGHRAVLREIHLSAAFLFAFGPTLVSLAGNRRAVVRTVNEVDGWTAADARWLLHPAADPGDDTPSQGRLNAGQKLNGIFTAYCTAAFAGTGLVLWQNRRFPFTVVSQANTMHSMLAYLALAVFLGHLYLAVVNRATRHALHGIVFGTVRRSWAEHHHPLWQYDGPQESALRPRMLATSVLLLAVGSYATLLVIRSAFEWLGANTTDAVTTMIYRLSTVPATAHPVTGTHVVDLGAPTWAGLLALVWVLVARGTRI